nr:unnamed protein product [Callosobruchus chinensis]
MHDSRAGESRKGIAVQECWPNSSDLVPYPLDGCKYDKDPKTGKRSSAGSRIPGSETNSLDGCDRDKSQLRPHQVHPAFDHHALLCYDDKLTVEAAVSPPVPVSMPPPPNICVEAGRIQFVRRDEDGAAVTAEAAAVNTQAVPRVTVTRGLQTDDLGNGTDVYEEDGVEEVQVGR